MEFNVFLEQLKEKVPHIEVRCDELLSKHTSFRIGGPAALMIFPKDCDELSAVLILANRFKIVPYILGAGTNVLAPDNGIQGVVICLKDCLNGIKLLDETHLEVMAGVTMTRAAMFAANHRLSGMEFAHGIPGTIGGGVYMNAGAYGGEISNICKYAVVMDLLGNTSVRSNEELSFSYRHSAIEDSGEIVVSVVLELTPEDPQKIKEKMKELMGKRSASQPLDLPSAGSAFKRPVGGYAAALIDQTNLKGFQVGNAAISTKHAGFAVNLGGATSEDVKELLHQVSERVNANTGIRLEPEIRIW